MKACLCGSGRSASCGERLLQALLVRHLETPRASLEAQVAVERDKDDLCGIARDLDLVGDGAGVDERDSVREVVLLPGGGAEDDVVHCAGNVVGRAVVAALVGRIGSAAKVDRLVADGKVLEVVAATCLDLEEARVAADRLLKVVDDLVCCNAERSRVALEAIEFGNNGEWNNDRPALCGDELAEELNRREEDVRVKDEDRVAGEDLGQRRCLAAELDLEAGLAGRASSRASLADDRLEMAPAGLQSRGG